MTCHSSSISRASLASHSWEVFSDIQRPHTNVGVGGFSLSGFLLEDFWRNGQFIEFLFPQLVEPATASFLTNTGKCISCQLWGYQPEWKSDWRVPSLHDVTDTSWMGSRYSVNQGHCWPITHSRAVCSVHEAWCLCSGASGKIARLPFLPRLTFSTNYLGRRPSEGACSKFICS